MSPTPRAAALLAVIALATVVVGPAVGLIAAVALAGATLADALAVRARPRIERRVAPILARGVAAPLTVAATPAGPGRVRLRQPIPPDLALDPREADGRLDATLTPLRRGRHTLGAVATRAEGPLRLGRWHHQDGEEHEVLVYPDLPAARRLALSVRQGRFREQGRLTRGPLGLGTDFESIRDYSPDDDVRQINWRATDRLGRPMSNQFRVEQDREVMLLIDAGRLMSAPLEDRTRLDAAVDAAVTVALVADVVGDRCGVVAFDDGIRRRLPPRRAGGDAVVRALFDLEPRPVDADYELAFQTVEGAKRSLIVVFCDLLEEAAARPLVDAVPVLARRHVVLVASVRDPDLDAQLATPPVLAPRRLRPGGGARRPGGARPRGASARARRGERPRGARGRAPRRLRPRLPSGQGPRAALSVRTPAPRDQAPEHHAEPDADDDRPAEASGRAAHEPLDEPGEHDPRHRAEHQLHRRARLTPQRLAARQRPGLDQRPADPQPGRGGDGDARQLEHAVREDELQQPGARAVLDREAEDRADEAAVEDQHRGRAQPGEDAAGDRQERHADVVREDHARQPGLVGRARRVARPPGSTTPWNSGGTTPIAAAGSSIAHTAASASGANSSTSAATSAHGRSSTRRQ